EPFFTTKEPGLGTGLGIPNSLAIVRGHRGVFRVESQLGAGTGFIICLPAVVVDDGGEGAPEVSGQLPRGAGETVLVIDDEESVLGMLSRTLEVFGYHVLAATGGNEALELYVAQR